MFTLTVSNFTHLWPVAELPSAVHNRIRDRLTFRNPQWIENKKRGFWNGKTPRELSCLWEQEDALVMPRGFTRQAIELLKSHGIQYQVNDQRRTLPPVDFHFTGELRDFQEEAVTAMFARDFGTLSAPTGSGKTVMALAIIAARNQPTLVVVHTKELLNQWIERIEVFLDIPAGEVGRIGGGKFEIGEKITVTLVQSLYRCAGEVAPHIGHLIVDECHRAPSRTFTECITAFDCRYQLGLSATPWRRDGLSRLIWLYVGDKVHEIDKAGLLEEGHILAAEVITRGTSFRSTVDPSTEYSKMLSQLCEDSERNALIASDVAQEARNGSGVILVLSDRKSHCDALFGLLEGDGIHAAVLTGDLSAKERQRIVENLNAGLVRVLFATGQLIGEGFDCKALSTLFLATPIKFSGRVLQYLGRVLRPAPGKEKAKVLDYVDPVGVLLAAARSRARVYDRAS